MGNRCVITTASDRSNNFGVYLHWNGGRDSVEAFLAYCKLKEYRSPDIDCYGWARLCQVIGNFFGGDTSIGFDLSNRLDCDNYDNGVFLIQDWEIVGRQYLRGGEQMEHDFKEKTPFFGLGSWTRANSELCLLATKGDIRRQARNVSQIILSPIERHSRKPDEARNRIAALMGDLPRIELFARETPDGWDVWGNEVESSVAL